MKRSDPVVASILFTTSLALYVRTLAHSLLYGDSAEFQTIAYALGIGHPTGYPVYVLLAKSFTFLPAGDVAYRVNLFSAFCAASTIAFVYLGIRRLGAMVPPAIYGSLALALTPLFWKHGTIAEIYAPSTACLTFILFAVLHWKDTNDPHWLFVAGLLGGLSLGIHTTIALAAPAILIYLILTFFFPLSPVKKKDFLSGLFGAILGIAIFLSSFLFLDHLNSPAGYYNTVVIPSLSVWNMTAADFDSPFERLAFLYFPPQFKGQFFNVPAEEVITRLKDFEDNVSWNLLPASLGFISLLIPGKDSPSRWHDALLLIFALITFLVFAATYNVDDFYVYYIPAGVILAVFIGLGVSAIVELFTLIPRMPHFLPVGISIVILALGFYPFIGVVSSHWSERIPPGLDDWEGYFFSFPDTRRLEAEQTVNNLEDNAIVFTDWDYAYCYYYAAHVLQGRTGMSFHETFPQEGVTRFADSATAYIEANIDTSPIYFSERPSYLAIRYKILPAGSGLYRIKRK